MGPLKVGIIAKTGKIIAIHMLFIANSNNIIANANGKTCHQGEQT